MKQALIFTVLLSLLLMAGCIYNSGYESPTEASSQSTEITLPETETEASTLPETDTENGTATKPPTTETTETVEFPNDTDDAYSKRY